MSEIQGVSMGLPSHPITRRVKKPKPFQRPSTTVSAPDVKREWRTIAAVGLAVGDTVPGIGTITDWKITGGRMIVAGGLGNTASWPMDEPVFAFTAASC